MRTLGIIVFSVIGVIQLLMAIAVSLLLTERLMGASFLAFWAYFIFAASSPAFWFLLAYSLAPPKKGRKG